VTAKGGEKTITIFAQLSVSSVFISREIFDFDNFSDSGNSYQEQMLLPRLELSPPVTI
jgi:hypothetical protein